MTLFLRRAARSLVLTLTLLAALQTNAFAAGKGGAKVGQPAPELSVEMVQNPDNWPDGARGKVVLLAFWIEGCAACLSDLRESARLYRAFSSQGLDVLMVNVGGTRAVVENTAKQHDLPFAMALDQLDLSAKRYGVGVYPTFFLIGRDGVIRARMAGELRSNVVEREMTAP